jgi:hypothetical protein
MSPQRLIAALTLACLPILSMLPATSAETPAQYVIKVQERTVKLFDNGNVYAVQTGAKRPLERLGHPERRRRHVAAGRRRAFFRDAREHDR